MRTERALLAFACATLAASAAAAVCPGGTSAIDQTLTTGSRWEICVESRAQEGVALRDVFFTPPAGTRRSVLKEATVAQIHVVYDDDSARQLLVSNPGLGAEDSIVALSAADCPSGTLLLSDTLCVTQAPRGYVWKDDTENKQGYLLELFSVAHTGAFTWIPRWRFYDDGTVEPAMGASGALSVLGANASYGSPVGQLGAVAVGWFTNVTWRLDFDIGASATDDFVERLEVANSGSTKSLSKTAITTEVGESYSPVVKRAWRVRDSSTNNSENHPISYYFEPMRTGHRFVPKASEAWAGYDFAVTVRNACERLAAGNPTAGGCAADLAGFLSGQSATGDVVVWVRSSEHHLPSDEDAPYLMTTWQSIAFGPRDWTTVNPLVP
jgi:primary-amine oxidase